MKEYLLTLLLSVAIIGLLCWLASIETWCLILGIGVLNFSFILFLMLDNDEDDDDDQNTANSNIN